MEDKAIQIWNYINAHQDQMYYQIAEDLNIPKDYMKDLIFFWALENKEMFNGMVVKHESLNQ